MRNQTSNFNRRDFLLTAGGALLLPLVNSGAVPATSRENNKQMLIYVGTYTSGKSRSEGIYLYKFNLQNGELTLQRTIKNVVEPSFLTVDKQHRYLYAVNETEKFAGKNSGAISAFAINQKDGDLQFLNQQPSLGGAPCYVSISDNGRFVLVANYAGGNVAVFPVEKNGALGTAVDWRQHSGASANKERQQAAHAHSIMLDRDNRFAIACDLGTDKIMIYRFDDKTGKLAPNAQLFFQAKAGAGPRHFAFHPNNELAFAINELDSTIASFAFDAKQGRLDQIQIVPTLPADFTGANTCADIHVAPNGKFLYGSNRGHDSIAAFRIDAQDGKLESIGHVSTGGKTPRNFAIDPTGAFLLAANQNSDSIVVFRIDQTSGKLVPTGVTAQVPSPVCLRLVPDFSV